MIQLGIYNHTIRMLVAGEGKGRVVYIMNNGFFVSMNSFILDFLGSMDWRNSGEYVYSLLKRHGNSIVYVVNIYSRPEW